MTTMREHLMAFHKMAAQHHLAMAQSCNKLSDCLGKTDAVKKPDAEEVADCLKAMSDEHVKAGEFHVGCAKALEQDTEKGMHIDRSERDGIRPDGVHRINPTDGLRLTPRTGAPTAPQTPKVAPGMEKFISIEEG